MTETLTLEEADVQETFFENGWTDGLPVVPPTPERVEAMLAASSVIDEQSADRRHPRPRARGSRSSRRPSTR